MKRRYRATLVNSITLESKDVFGSIVVPYGLSDTSAILDLYEGSDWTVVDIYWFN